MSQVPIFNTIVRATILILVISNKGKFFIKGINYIRLFPFYVLSDFRKFNILCKEKFNAEKNILLNI